MRGEFGEYVGCLGGVGGLAQAFGEVGDRGAERGIGRGAGVGVEALVAVDVVPDSPQAPYGIDGETGLFVLGQADGARW
ncbi:hypothetical protein ACFVN4_03145 [Streptomyces rochei]|uniref:hypothetical protein n=1 Tax=Streptomyces rochei TaxID=1928 RepID=UPI0036C3D313